MNYKLSIRDHNKQAHADLEKEIELKKNGQLTFILRVNNGNIVDFQVMEVVTALNYISLK